jgi:hypothetical protein
MRAVAGYLIVALLLAGGGMVLLQGSHLERRLAQAERDLVTLRYQDAGTVADEAPPAWAALWPGGEEAARTARELGSTSKYWQGDYGTVAADPAAKLLAANAAYRAMRREGGNWQAVVGRLDGIVKAYAEVLRDDPNNAEAAYNFEFATRLRAVIAARRQNLTPNDPIAAGMTIHGGVGEVPIDSESRKFKMIIPMRPDERQEAEKAGKGGTRIRKG